jgi:CRP/FNR family transcriptional regulator
MAVLRHYERGTIIFNQGDPCPGVFVVGTGLVRVFLVGTSGKEQVLHLVSPGGTFAEVAAVGGFDCPAFADAVEATTCLLLPNQPFRKALYEDHALCMQLLSGFAGWVRNLVGLLEDITLRDAAGRVARYLLEAAEAPGHTVRWRSPKKHLASYLNLTSETLSRTLRRLTEAGLIVESEEGILTIVLPEQLRAVADGMFPGW